MNRLKKLTLIAISAVIVTFIFISIVNSINIAPSEWVADFDCQRINLLFS